VGAVDAAVLEDPLDDLLGPGAGGAAYTKRVDRDAHVTGGADDQGIGEILPDFLHRREVGHEIDHDLALGGVREVTHERLCAHLVPASGSFGEPLLGHAGEPLDPVGGRDLVVDPVDLVEVLPELRVGHAAKFLEHLGHWPALAYDSPDSLKGHTATKRAV